MIESAESLPTPHTIGVISDTHGLIRPEALAALAGVEAIIHAGDVGTARVIEALERIAPVYAVRGNVDRGAWAEDLPLTRRLTFGAATLFVIHNLRDLQPNAPPAGVDVVISGHSHRPQVERRNGVLYLNPGSAGPRRFTLPIALARLYIRTRRLDARLIELTPAPI